MARIGALPPASARPDFAELAGPLSGIGEWRLPMIPTRMFCAAALLAAMPPSAPGPPPDWLAAASREIAARGADDRFSGVVLVARGGKAVLQEARGFADVDRRIPISPDTRFNLGSMNKMFTAVA